MVCVHISVRKGELTERGGRVYRKKLDVVPSQMRSEGMGVGGREDDGSG
jgi:hypothetical protein